MATLEDVLFGDVWFCNGQSNMELPVRWVSEGSQDFSKWESRPPGEKQ